VQPFNYSGKSAIFRTELAKTGLELALDPVNDCSFTSYWIAPAKNRLYTICNSRCAARTLGFVNMKSCADVRAAAGLDNRQAPG
jgi:hypothetical protein